MQIKDSSVKIHGLQIQMLPVLKNAGHIWKDMGEELVVTSARDGIHSAGSLHYYGYAVDFRSRYFSRRGVGIVANRLRDTLGSDYQVIVHSTHIHVEYEKAKDLI